jgi:hypothetical protein
LGTKKYKMSFGEMSHSAKRRRSANRRLANRRLANRRLANRRLANLPGTKKIKKVLKWRLANETVPSSFLDHRRSHVVKGSSEGLGL